MLAPAPEWSDMNLKDVRTGDSVRTANTGHRIVASNTEQETGQYLIRWVGGGSTEYSLGQGLQPIILNGTGPIWADRPFVR